MSPSEPDPSTEDVQPSSFKTPFVLSIPHAPKLSPLTSYQESQYLEVLAAVSSWDTEADNDANDNVVQPLQERERLFLTRECLLRYLRATKWNVDNAIKRIRATILWRRASCFWDISADDVGSLNQSGKYIQLGYDRNARPCLYFDVLLESPDLRDKQIDHLCYMTERTIDMMPPNVEDCTFIIDLTGMTRANIWTMAKMRAYINVFQEHNPERLGVAIIGALPWYAQGVWRLVSRFIDPVTRQKIQFQNNNNRQYVQPEQLWKRYGGELDFEYDHDVYWEGLAQICQQRREEYKRRWEARGRRIGESETYLRGGKVDSESSSSKEEPS